MTLPLTLPAAELVVVWGGFVIGLVLGGATQASRFCTMGALTDYFAFGGTSRLLMWAMVVAVAGLGCEVVLSTGMVDASKTLAWSPRFLWLSYIVGGLLFGLGMALASGCPQRNLVRAGAGNLKAIVTLLVAALSAQMALRGIFAVPRVNWLDSAGTNLSGPQDLGSILTPYVGVSAMHIRWALITVFCLVVVAAWRRSRAQMETVHLVCAVTIGLLVPFALLLTGYMGFVPEHPETLEPAWLGTYSHRPELVTFAAPIAHGLDLLTLWSDKSNVLTYGVTVALGGVLGSAGMSLARKEFRWESFSGHQDLAHHLLGGLLMGVGGVTAMGCSIGQGISGLAMLSAGAVIAVMAIGVGCWLGYRYLTWSLERSAS